MPLLGVSIMLTIEYFNRLAFIEQKQAPEIRFERVMNVRQKLKSRKYNLDEHLNIALDRLIEEIIGQDSEIQVNSKNTNISKK